MWRRRYTKGVHKCIELTAEMTKVPNWKEALKFIEERILLMSLKSGVSNIL
jgi:hypothetical protein